MTNEELRKAVANEIWRCYERIGQLVEDECDIPSLEYHVRNRWPVGDTAVRVVSNLAGAALAMRDSTYTEDY